MKNLLLVSIEDLNDWIEPLGGHPQTHTPNISRLAGRSVVFTQAYATAPACSPSRTATLFSKYPWETGVYSNGARWDDFFERGSRQSIIGHLRQAGMTTYGCGKVFHSSYRADLEAGTLDNGDWTEFHLAPKVDYPPISNSVQSGDLNRHADFGVDPTGLPSYDDHNTDWIVEKMQPGAESHVWALGIYRPHLPFIAPREFFDLIPAEVSLPPGLGAKHFNPENMRLIKSLPGPAKRMARRLMSTGQALAKNGEYNDFLRAYLASIAYADSKLGLVLDRLEECGLMEDTLIVLWSDHGWQLGEKLAFRKFTLWERALRIPLMFGGADIEPAEVQAPASLIDLAPTILALLDVTADAANSGQDLTPAIRGSGPLARCYAPSVWGVGLNNPENVRLAYSVRSERYRLTKYWNDSYELYDHASDPFEHANLAGADFSPLTEGLSPEIKELDAAISSMRAIAVPPLDWQSNRPRSGEDEDDDDED